MAYLDASAPELRLSLPDEIFTTPHGERFHLKGCKHLRGNFKKFTPGKDCRCKLQQAWCGWWVVWVAGGGWVGGRCSRMKLNGCRVSPPQASSKHSAVCHL